MSTKEAGRGQAASGSRPDDEVRSFYRNYHDNIQDKRLDSPYPLRRYVHRAIQDSTLESVREFVKPGARILDAGCGEGSLVLAMAGAFSQDNVSVTGVDLSEPNLSAGRPRAGRGVSFQVAEALLHGPEQIADLPVPVAESPGAVRIGHPERSHLVEYLAPNSVFNSLPRQRSSPHLRPDDRLVTIDRVLHHASLGVA